MSNNSLQTVSYKDLFYRKGKLIDYIEEFSEEYWHGSIEMGVAVSILLRELRQKGKEPEEDLRKMFARYLWEYVNWKPKTELYGEHKRFFGTCVIKTLNENLFEYYPPLGNGMHIFTATGVRGMQILPYGKFIEVEFDNGYYVRGFIKEGFYFLNEPSIRQLEVHHNELDIHEKATTEDYEHGSITLTIEDKFYVKYSPTQSVDHDRLMVEFDGDLFLDIAWRKVLMKKDCL